ncbi:MAG: hypothetical protein RSB58_09265 [Clostridium sp.]
MMVDYSFYKDKYGGSIIPESAWLCLVRKTEARLQEFTFNRLTEPWSDLAKYALCEMAECIYDSDKRDGKSSENTDGYSVSYDVLKSVTSKLYSIASTYLLCTDLMDLGV